MNNKVSFLVMLFVIFTIFGNRISAQDDYCGTEPEKFVIELQNKGFLPDSGKTFQIPVIFHVLYENDKENIPDEQLKQRLTELHNDFLTLNADYSTLPNMFSPFAGNPKVKFILARTLPDGTATTGIIRKKTELKIYSGRNKRRMFMDSPIVAPDKYLNVYICDLDKLAGVRFSGDARYDGIVVDYWFAKSTTRTISHETGHWLGLPHVWDFGRTREKKCGDDYITDTPRSKKHKPLKKYTHPLKECGSNAVMFMNFMDYGPVRYFFTEEQVKVMRQKILIHKPGITTIN